MGIYDVQATFLIEEAAKKLGQEIEQPKFVEYAKTGAHRERAPSREDWFSVRLASILYRTYKSGVVGTERLRTYYGGKKNRGVKPEHQYKASGKVIRVCLQKLEEKGYLEKAKPKGRKITAKGTKFLNEVSKIAEQNFKAGVYTKHLKVIKEDAKKKEVEKILRGQEHHGKDKDKKKDEKKKPKKKDGEE